MPKWEYACYIQNYVAFPSPHSEAQFVTPNSIAEAAEPSEFTALNRLGRDGWEVIAIEHSLTNGSSKIVEGSSVQWWTRRQFWLKRQISDPA
jgi:hypothetical protein